MLVTKNGLIQTVLDTKHVKLGVALGPDAFFIDFASSAVVIGNGIGYRLPERFIFCALSTGLIGTVCLADLLCGTD